MLHFSVKQIKLGLQVIVMAMVMLVGVCQAEDLLVVRPDEMNFKNALDGMAAEIDDEFTIFDQIIDRDTKVEELEIILAQKKPKLIVLMEGKSLALYGKWQQTKGEDYRFPPALVFMTVYAEERIRSLKNTVGIKYEIQAVHSVSSLRSVLAQPVNKVGVLYSKNLRLFFASQKQACMEREQIELQGVMIDESLGHLDRTIDKQLGKLLKDPTIDAIWIWPDSVILKDVYLEWAWVPRLKKSKKPVLVSLERLLFDLKLGHFAVVPDHYEMGTQAARWIFQINESGWIVDPDEPKTRRPYSARKKINRKRIPRSVKLNETVVSEEWADSSTRQN